MDVVSDASAFGRDLGSEARARAEDEVRFLVENIMGGSATLEGLTELQEAIRAKRDKVAGDVAARTVSAYRAPFDLIRWSPAFDAEVEGIFTSLRVTGVKEVDQFVARSAARHGELVAQLVAAHARLASAKSAAGLSREIDHVSALLKNGALLGALDALDSLRERCASLPEDGAEVLRSTCDALQRQCQAEADGALGAMLRWDDVKSCLKISSSLQGKSLPGGFQEFWNVHDRLGTLAARLQALGSQIQGRLLLPVLRGALKVRVVEAGHSKVVQWAEEEAPPPAASWSARAAFLSRTAASLGPVTAAVHQVALCGNPTLVAVAFPDLAQTAAAAILHDLLHPLLPGTSLDLLRALPPRAVRGLTGCWVAGDGGGGGKGRGAVEATGRLRGGDAEVLRLRGGGTGDDAWEGFGSGWGAVTGGAGGDAPAQGGAGEGGEGVARAQGARAQEGFGGGSGEPSSAPVPAPDGAGFGDSWGVSDSAWEAVATGTGGSQETTGKVPKGLAMEIKRPRGEGVGELGRGAREVKRPGSRADAAVVGQTVNTNTAESDKRGAESGAGDRAGIALPGHGAPVSNSNGNQQQATVGAAGASKILRPGSRQTQARSTGSASVTGQPGSRGSADASSAMMSSEGQDVASLGVSTQAVGGSVRLDNPLESSTVGVVNESEGGGSGPWEAVGVGGEQRGKAGAGSSEIHGGGGDSSGGGKLAAAPQLRIIRPKKATAGLGLGATAAGKRGSDGGLQGPGESSAGRGAPAASSSGRVVATGGAEGGKAGLGASRGLPLGSDPAVVVGGVASPPGDEEEWEDDGWGPEWDGGGGMGTQEAPLSSMRGGGVSDGRGLSLGAESGNLGSTGVETLGTAPPGLWVGASAADEGAAAGGAGGMASGGDPSLFKGLLGRLQGAGPSRVAAPAGGFAAVRAFSRAQSVFTGIAGNVARFMERAREAERAPPGAGAGLESLAEQMARFFGDEGEGEVGEVGDRPRGESGGWESALGGTGATGVDTAEWGEREGFGEEWDGVRRAVDAMTGAVGGDGPKGAAAASTHPAPLQGAAPVMREGAVGAAGASEPWRGDRGAESGHGGASVKQGVVGGAVEVTRSAQVAAVTVGNESTSARDAETRGTQRQAGSTGERQAGTQSSVVSARERGPDRPGGAAMAEGGSEGFGAHAASAFASVGDATGAEAPVQPEVDPWDAAAARVWMRETCGASVDVGSFAAEAEAVEQVAAALVAARRVDAALGPLCPAGEDGHGSDLAQGLLEMEQDLLGQAEGQVLEKAGEAVQSQGHKQSVFFHASGGVVVSQTTVALLFLVTRATACAVLCGTPLHRAAALRALSHVCALFRTVPYQTHEEDFGDPRLMMLYANDCEQLARRCADLARVALVPQQPGAEPALAEVAEAAQRGFHSLELFARGVLKAELQRQRARVGAALDMAGGFCNVDRPAQGERARGAVDEALACVAQVTSQWSKALSPRMYLVAAADMLQFLCGRIVDELLEMADIGADESDALHGTLLPLVREGPLRMGFVPDTQPHEELLARAPAYDKLRLLLAMLAARMTEVVDMWTRGDLRRAGFSAAEVCGVVRAVFTDSQRRADAIQIIQGAAGEGEPRDARGALRRIAM